jgi:hypothetical protein
MGGEAVTDDVWEQRRKRAIMVAFQTGRPVFGDSEGALHYADGDREPIADDAGMAARPLPAAAVQRTWWARVKHWLGGRT